MSNVKLNDKNELVRTLEHPDKWMKVGEPIAETQFEFNPAQMLIRADAETAPGDRAHTTPASVRLEGERLIHKWAHGDAKDCWVTFRPDLHQAIMGILDKTLSEPMSMIGDVPEWHPTNPAFGRPDEQ